VRKQSDFRRRLCNEHDHPIVWPLHRRFAASSIAAILSVAAAPCLADNEIIVNVYADDDIPEGTGHFRARFHRLPLHPELEKSRFFSREITGFYVSPCNVGPCIFIKISAEGHLDGEEGLTVAGSFDRLDLKRAPSRLCLAR